MFGEKAAVLIKELDRNRDIIPPYNSELIKEIQNEVMQLLSENQEDAQQLDQTNSITETHSYIPTIRIRHAALKRNIRCLLAYHYTRLKCLRQMRWEFGSLLPTDIKTNLNQTEIKWFTNYSKNLAKYMRNIGDDGGINLAIDLKPPKSLYIEVRCLTDYGKFELNDGTVLLLKKNTRHYLPRNECEELIRQGIFEHVS